MNMTVDWLTCGHKILLGYLPLCLSIITENLKKTLSQGVFRVLIPVRMKGL
jgi:hypothetical protein